MAEAIKNNNALIGKKDVIAFIAFIVTYFPTLVWMWDRWWARDSYYSHGILVPIVTIYLIRQMRKELANIPREESNVGIVLIVIGLIIHIISSILRIYFTSGFSMLIVLCGLILFLYGNKIFAKIAFPIAFLFFMIPLPQVAVANISFKLKLLAAHIATGVLNAIRIPAIREGSIIKMRNAHVVVDDVCSGLRSLIALTALGSYFSFTFKSTAFKRTVLFLSTIPIAIITNVCRVVFLSFISEIWGIEYASGFVHDLSGFLVFVFACIMLYGVKEIIE